MEDFAPASETTPEWERVQPVLEKLSSTLCYIGATGSAVAKTGGSGIITGSFTTQQTQEQALLLRSGALPATLSIIQESTVGADLGADAIHSGTEGGTTSTRAGPL